MLIEKPFYLKEKNFRLSLDSGAHTLFKDKFARGKTGDFNRQFADYDYTNSPDFKLYLDKYIEHLCEHKDFYDFYVTLDIIGNAEKSWEITEYMESYGLKPIPVFHFGENISWMKKMLDKYDYIGIGGLGQDITKERFFPFADPIFKLICNKNGTPCVKTHGFAVASAEVLLRYPWYTADSSTWTTLSRNGAIYLPKLKIEHGQFKGFDYSRVPTVIPTVTGRFEQNTHLLRLTTTVLEKLKEYVAQYGYTLDDLIMGYHVKDHINIEYFLALEKVVKQIYAEKYSYGEGGNVLLAGTPAGSSTNKKKFATLIRDVGDKKTNWLGSFYYENFLKTLLIFKKTALKEGNLQDIQKGHDEEELSSIRKRVEKFADQRFESKSIKNISKNIKAETKGIVTENENEDVNKIDEKVDEMDQPFLIEKKRKRFSKEKLPVNTTLYKCEMKLYIDLEFQDLLDTNLLPEHLEVLEDSTYKICKLLERVLRLKVKRVEVARGDLEFQEEELISELSEKIKRIRLRGKGLNETTEALEKITNDKELAIEATSVIAKFEKDQSTLHRRTVAEAQRDVQNKTYGFFDL